MKHGLRTSKRCLEAKKSLPNFLVDVIFSKIAKISSPLSSNKGKTLLRNFEERVGIHQSYVFNPKPSDLAVCLRSYGMSCHWLHYSCHIVSLCSEILVRFSHYNHLAYEDNKPKSVQLLPESNPGPFDRKSSA